MSSFRRAGLLAALTVLVAAGPTTAETYLLKGGGRVYGVVEKEYKDADKQSWLTVRTSYGRVSFKKTLLKKTLKTERDRRTVYIEEARVFSLSGQAWRSADNGETWELIGWEKPPEGTAAAGDDDFPPRVAAGERVRTDAASSLVLDVGWGVVRLDAESELELAAYEGATLKLLRGRAGARVDEMPETRQFRVETVQATMAVKGTVFSVAVSGSSTRCSVVAGVVEMDGVDIGGGQTRIVSSEDEPGLSDLHAGDEVFLRAARGGGAFPALDWVVIPGGTFRMGDGKRYGKLEAAPINEVAIRPFLMARHELTIAQYRAFLDWTGTHGRDRLLPLGCPPATYFSETGVGSWDFVDERWTAPHTCATGVTWWAAAALARWQSARLPSESEWEYAARGGCDGSYVLGYPPERLNDYAWTIYNTGDKTVDAFDPAIGFRELPGSDSGSDSGAPGTSSGTGSRRGPLPPRGPSGSDTDAPADWVTYEKVLEVAAALRCYPRAVGLKLPNGYGLHDTLGNASEWVQDAEAPDYRRTPTDGSAHSGPADARRVRRGGRFLDSGHAQLTPTRTSAPPTQLAGVRLARDLPE